MTEEEIQLEAEKKAAEESAKKKAEERAAELKTKSVEELAELVRSTQSEARDRRLKERELEEKIAKMEADQKEAEDAKLLKDGKVQELLDAKILELTNIQSELGKVKIVAEESTNFKAAQVEIYKKQMGVRWNDEYANLSLTALDTLVNQSTPKKVATDGGVDDDHPNVELTPDQKREADAMYPFVEPKERRYELHKYNLIKLGKIKKE